MKTVDGITKFYVKWGHRSFIFTLICIVWLAWRVGTKPARISYPCSQFAISQISLFFGSLSIPTIGICYKGILYFRRREYKKIAAMTLIILAMVVAFNLYQNFQVEQLRMAGSGTIPVSSSALSAGMQKGTPATGSPYSGFPSSPSMEQAVVSFSHNTSIYYGGTPPYDQADNPAYDLVWETVERLELGSSENPLDDLIDEGDTVLFKPNWVGFGPGTYTRPEVVRPLIDMAIIAGADHIYIGDGGEDVSLTDYVMDSANYTTMVSILASRYPGTDIQTVNLNERNAGWHWISLGSDSSFAGSGYSNYDLGTGSTTLYGSDYYHASDTLGVNPDGDCLGWYAVNDYVLNADVIINVPKLKTHQEMIATNSLKNFVGLTLSSTYNDSSNMERIAHHHQPLEENYFTNDIFWRAILDMNKIVLYADVDGVLQSAQQRKYLTVVDAIQSMEKSQHHSYGGGGIPYDTYCIMAGVDPVAVDAVGCRIMGYDYSVIPSIYNADSDILHPIGTNDPDKVAVIGDNINSSFSYVFEYNTNWDTYAGDLPVTDFVPPQINSVLQQDYTITADISNGFSAYVLYETGSTVNITKMSVEGDSYSATIPEDVTEYRIIAQDEYFNTSQAMDFTEYISFTITDYGGDGVNFGSLDPGVSNQPADGQPVQGAVTVTVGAETNVDVAVRVRGNDFSGPVTLPVTVVSYYEKNNAAKAATLTTYFTTVYSVLAGTSFEEYLYFWITVPTGQPAGNYTSTFYFEAVKAE